jgi:hypothetical protein
VELPARPVCCTAPSCSLPSGIRPECLPGPRTPGRSRMTICALSGLRAGPRCPPPGGMVRARARRRSGNATGNRPGGLALPAEYQEWAIRPTRARGVQCWADERRRFVKRRFRISSPRMVMCTRSHPASSPATQRCPARVRRRCRWPSAGRSTVGIPGTTLGPGAGPVRLRGPDAGRVRWTAYGFGSSSRSVEYHPGDILFKFLPGRRLTGDES